MEERKPITFSITVITDGEIRSDEFYTIERGDVREGGDWFGMNEAEARSLYWWLDKVLGND